MGCQVGRHTNNNRLELICHYMNRSYSFLAVLLCGIVANAQTVMHGVRDAQNILFEQSVKSCDEFMCRFNEEEFFPDLSSNDSLRGRHNFQWLFDYMLFQGQKRDSLVMEVDAFYGQVKRSNTKLRYESKNWYAELRTNFTYKNQNVELGLVFRNEITPKGLQCWTIVGVNGLEQVGFNDKEERLVISPEQHEADFMEIESDFKFNSKTFSRFRSFEAELSSLSYFFALVESGVLVFNRRISTFFHFFDVPSYYFKVDFCSRKKANNGWLITDFRKTDEKELNNIINKILGI